MGWCLQHGWIEFEEIVIYISMYTNICHSPISIWGYHHFSLLLHLGPTISNDQTQYHPQCMQGACIMIMVMVCLCAYMYMLQWVRVNHLWNISLSKYNKINPSNGCQGYLVECGVYSSLDFCNLLSLVCNHTHLTYVIFICTLLNLLWNVVRFLYRNTVNEIHAYILWLK